MDARHKPVMVEEVLTNLKVKAGGRFVDCTVGEGGHALAVLKASSAGSRLLGIDMDADALRVATRRLQPYEDRVTLVNGSFAELGEIAREADIVPANGVLFDLGVSSLQLETQDRGFSFNLETRPDMRFDLSQKKTAYQVVNQYPEEKLTEVISQYGEEPRARKVARAIVNSRPIETTTQLADILTRTVGRPMRRAIHPATRTFQALRIEVNRELENLQHGLEQAFDVLAPGGRLVTISYHSLEDRLAKTALRREASDCICPPGTPACVCGHKARVKLVNRKVIKPSQDEVRANPRCRSARIRVAERI